MQLWLQAHVPALDVSAHDACRRFKPTGFGGIFDPAAADGIGLSAIRERLASYEIVF
jgi:hypothetical protein